MKATLQKRVEIAPNIWTFYFKPEKPVHYIAGQFTELYLPHRDKDKRGEKRWFTLSSAPSDELLAITTKFTSQGGSSFKNALFSLDSDTEVSFASPMGDFVLPKDPSVPLIFVAGGIGSTPFRSIIAELHNTGEDRDVQLLYAAHAKEDVAFTDTFGRLGDKFVITTGTLTAEQVIKLTNPTPDHYIYISGPEPLVEQLLKDLKTNGTNKKHIYTDYFPGYSITL